MQEKFGVELVAILNQFKAKMNEAKQIGEKTSDSIKNKMKIQPDVNVEQFKKQLKDPEIGKSWYSFNGGKLGSELSQIVNPVEKINTSMNKLENSTKKTSKELKNISNNSKNIKNIGANIKTMGNEFGNAIKKVRRFALALLSVRSIYSVLSKASQAYMSFDTQLSAKLQSAWAGLGAQLAPIIEYIVNLFAKAIAYVNAFIKALTGINMVARANAKALNNQAKATGGAGKAANKALASFDELNNINQDSGAGGGGGEAETPQIELPEVDTSKLEGALNRIKEIASTLFEPIQNAWNTYGEGVISSINFALTSTWDLMKEIGSSFAEVWTNGTGEKTVGLILQIFTNLLNIIGAVGEALRKAWANNNNGTKIVQFLADTFNAILDFVNSIAESLKNWILSDSFQTMLNYVVQIVKDLIGYVSDIATWIVDIYKKYLAPVVDEVLLLISDVITMVGAIWTAVKPVVDKIINILKAVLEPVIATLTQMIRVAIQVIRDIVNAITWVAQNWDKVWNGMKSVARAVVNGIIGFMNLWINGLNAMLLPLRSVISLIAKAFGKNVSIGSVKIPNIPYLAQGTNYVPEDQMAYIHKGEAVVPKKFNSAEYFNNINDNKETNELLRRLINVVDEKDTNTYLDGKQIGQSTVNYINQQSRILGRSVV